MEIVQVLKNALNEDQAIRKQAEEFLRQAEQQNYLAYVLTLLNELATEEQHPNVRRLAGVILKNTLERKDEVKVKKWISLDSNAKQQAKSLVLKALGSPERNARSVAAQVTSKIALIEIPRKEWNELIPQLLTNMTSPQTTDFLKESTLQTFGYVCEEIEVTAIQEQSNLILTAVVQGMRKENNNAAVTLAATTALLNALEFVRSNFEKENERNVIMQVVLETTLFPDQEVKVAAYQVLERIGCLYYHRITPFMDDIFKLTMTAISTQEGDVPRQAIEFWSSICEEEIEILSGEDDRQSQDFIKKAFIPLTEVLMNTMTKQEEFLQEDTWNEAMAASTCLGFVSNIVGDEIINVVAPFIQAHFQHEDWRKREAATMVFGQILEGPSQQTLIPMISGALPILISHLRDPNEIVKDTTAWTIGRICELHSDCVRDWNTLVTSLIHSLRDPPRVAAHACTAFHNIAAAFYQDDAQETSPLSPFFTQVIQHLLAAGEREDAAEENLRISAYEAVNEFIRCAPSDCLQHCNQLVTYFTQQLEKTFSFQPLNNDDRENLNEQQGLLCGGLLVITQKLGVQIKPFSDRIMTLYLTVLQSRSATVQEEVLIAVGALANAIEADFERYLPSFNPHLLQGLSNGDEYNVCSAAVGVVGDISRAIGDKLLMYTDDIITLLLRNLGNPSLNRTVKPPILSCFGDVALAIGGNFDKYLSPVTEVLGQAANTIIDKSDSDQVDFLNSLREGIFEAWTGIIQGLRTDNKALLLLPSAEQIVLFIEHVINDPITTDEVVRAAIGVIGDFALCVDGKETRTNTLNLTPEMVKSIELRVKQILTKDSLRDIINKSAKSHSNESVSSTAEWVKRVISNLNLH